MGLRIQVRHDTAANWTSVNPVPAVGEPCFDTTNLILKIGDGVTAWASLPTANLGPAVLGPAVDALYSVPLDIASLGVGVTQGAPHAQTQLGPGKRTYLSGQLSLAAATYANGSTLATLPAGTLPAGAVQFVSRTVGSNTVFQLHIDTAGVVTNVGQLIVGATDTINIDGMNFVHA